MDRRRGTRYNVNALILCGLVFFVIVATIFCMVANGREAAREERRIAAEQQAAKEQEAAEKKAQEEAEAALEARKKSDSLQPGVPVGTTEAPDDEKVVYLTFDDGPSKNTQRVLDILAEYDAKATFFITGQQPEYFSMIKTAYDAGHTIGLHSYIHEYDQVYASVDAYFKDLEKIGELAKEQIGFVPCYIRFPGGASNTVSRKYTEGIMSELTQKVLEKGYQNYDWNISSGDGSKATK